MSASQTIAPYLPFLRRYARALTGNQASGDAYVAASLEALIEDPSILQGAASPRVALYRLFTKIWNSVGINSETSELDPDMPADMRLASLTPKPRQAFLLVALEGFSEEDAALVLGVDVATLRSLVEDSGRELAGEHIVGFLHLIESFRRARIAAVSVGVIFLHEFAVGGFNFFRRGSGL